MTKDEWLLVKQQLSTPWGTAQLLVDGYRLTLQVQQRAPLKFEIVPYVNGEFKGTWFLKDSEEGKRFLRPVEVRLYKPAQLKKLTKGFSKATIKSVFGDRLDKTTTHREWGWPTFWPLQRHLVANNKVIERIEPTDVTAVQS